MATIWVSSSLRLYLFITHCEPEMSLNVDTLSGGVLENCSNETLYTHSGVAGSFKETLVVDGKLHKSPAVVVL